MLIIIQVATGQFLGHFYEITTDYESAIRFSYDKAKSEIWNLKEEYPEVKMMGIDYRGLVEYEKD